jgi:hypothetical protein
MDDKTLARLRDQDAVWKLWRAAAALCVEHELTVGDVRSAVGRCLEQWLRLGLTPTKDLGNVDALFVSGVLNELKSEVEWRARYEKKGRR